MSMQPTPAASTDLPSLDDLLRPVKLLREAVATLRCLRDDPADAIRRERILRQITAGALVEEYHFAGVQCEANVMGLWERCEALQTPHLELVQDDAGDWRLRLHGPGVGLMSARYPTLADARRAAERSGYKHIVKPAL
jgi:hypothetical protein